MILLVIVGLCLLVFTVNSVECYDNTVTEASVDEGFLFCSIADRSDAMEGANLPDNALLYFTESDGFTERILPGALESSSRFDQQPYNWVIVRNVASGVDPVQVTNLRSDGGSGELTVNYMYVERRPESSSFTMVGFMDTPFNINFSSRITDEDTPTSEIWVVIDRLPDSGQLSLFDAKTVIDSAPTYLESNQMVTYTPASGYTGVSDEYFTFSLDDGSRDSGVWYNCSITVISTFPVLQDIPATTLEDFGLIITLSSSSSSYEEVEFSLQSTLSKGNVHQYYESYETGSFKSSVMAQGDVVMDSQGRIIYVPKADDNGVISFSVGANFVGHSSISVATVTVTIIAVDDPPYGPAELSVVVVEDTLTKISMVSHDIDSDPFHLLFNITVLPTKGKIYDTQTDTDPLTIGELVNLNVYYIQDPEYENENGLAFDSFEYKVVESETVESVNSTLVIINVQAKEDDIIPLSTTFSVDEDIMTWIPLSFIDVDNDPVDELYIEITTFPTHGVLNNIGSYPRGIATQVTEASPKLENGIFVVAYTPSELDQVTIGFKVTRASGLVSSEGSVTVSIISSAPVFVLNVTSMRVETPQSTPVPITLEAQGGTPPYTFTIEELPLLGVLSDSTTIIESTPYQLVSGSTVIFTPIQYEYGTDYASFLYSATDSVDNFSDNGTVLIDVNNTFIPPLTKNQSVDVVEDESLLIILDIVNFEFTSDSWTAIITDLPHNGYLYQVGELGNPEGKITEENTTVSDGENTPLLHRVLYVPDPDVDTSDWFGYKVVNAIGTESEIDGNIYINIIGVNDPPVAESAKFDLNESVSTLLPITLVTTDPDTLPEFRTITILEVPEVGTLQDTENLMLVSGQNLAMGVFDVQYISPHDNSKYASFTYHVSDEEFASDQALIEIIIVPANNNPVVTNVSDSTDQYVYLLIVLSATDIDGDGYTIHIVNQPENGKLYQVNEISGVGDVFSSETTVVTDGEGTTLFHRVYYLSNDGYSSEIPDEFTFKAVDTRGGESNIGTAFITVININEAPGFSNLEPNLIGEEDMLLIANMSLYVYDGDTELSQISFRITNGPDPDKGTSTINCSGATTDLVINTLYSVVECLFQYLPKENANGIGYDQFTFDYYDGELYSARTETASINIREINDPPVAIDSFAVTDESTRVEVFLIGSDIENMEMTAKIQSLPKNGSLYRDDNNGGNQITSSYTTDYNRIVVYLPNEGFFGTDSFTFNVKDSGNLNSENIATATITVNFVDDSPIVSDVLLSVIEDELVSFTLSVYDPDTESGFTLYFASLPVNGILSAVVGDSFLPVVINDAFDITQEFSYKPDPDFDQTDSFKYYASDGNSFSEQATITCVVTPVNDAPVASDVEYPDFLEDTIGRIDFSATDIDNDVSTLGVMFKSLPEHGTLFYEDGTVIAINRYIDLFYVLYLPDPNWFGEDQFLYTACNDPSEVNFESNVAVVRITVAPVNDAPDSCSDGSVSVNEDSNDQITICFEDVDSPVSNIMARVSMIPSTLGELQQNDSTQITVINTEITSSYILGDQAFFVVRFEPPANLFGNDYYVFEVTASDGEDGSPPFVVSVSVTNVGDPPVPTDGNFTVDEDYDLLITVNFTDLDIPDDYFTLKVILFPDASLVSLYQYSATTPDNTGDQILENSNLANQDLVKDAQFRFIFRPDPDESGFSSTIVIQITDRFGLFANYTAEIYVNPVNDAPEASDIALMIRSNADAQTIPMEDYFSDIENDPLSYLILQEPGRGSLSTASGFQISTFPSTLHSEKDYLIFTPADSKGCPFLPATTIPYAQLSYLVSDGEDNSSLATLTVTVTCDTDKNDYLNVWACGNICQQCPHGAECSKEGRHAPGNQLGYWESERKAFEFLSCFPEETCPEYSLSTEFSTSSQLFPVSQRVCSQGYQGFICGDCSPHYYRHSFYCTKCPETMPSAAIFMWVFLTILFVSLLFVVAFSDLDIGVVLITFVFLQTLLLLDGFRQEDATDDSGLSIYGLIADMYSIRCSFSSTVSFATQWTAIMSIYVLISSSFVILGASAKLLLYILLLQENLQHYRTPLRTLVWSCRNGLAGWLTVSYLLFLPTALSPLDCTGKQDGRYVLDARPSELCYDDAWWDMSAFYILGFLYFAVFLPLLQYYTLFIERPPSAYTAECAPSCPWIRRPRDPLRLRRERQLQEANLRIRRQLQPDNTRRLSFDPVYAAQFAAWESKYGVITSTFHPVVFYWDLVNTARKLCLVIPQVFFTSFPMTQSILTTMVLVISIFIHLYANPYHSPTLNRIELCTLLCCFFVTVSTMLVYGDPGFKNYWLGQAFDYFTTIFVFAAVVFIVFLVFLFILKALFNRFESVRRYVPDILLLYMEDKDGEFEQLRRRKRDLLDSDERKRALKREQKERAQRVALDEPRETETGIRNISNWEEKTEERGVTSTLGVAEIQEIISPLTESSVSGDLDDLDQEDSGDYSDFV